MWISDRYYKKLLSALEDISKGNFDENYNELKDFKDRKYNKLNEAFFNMQKNLQFQEKEACSMFESIIDGTYDFIDFEKNTKPYYEYYNKTVAHLNKLNEHIEKIQKDITKYGKVSSRIEMKEFNGKWLQLVSNINLTLQSLATPIGEIINVINGVARGNLNNKMRLKIDEFEMSGDFLNISNTINTMVDQLAQFASEVTRVAREVGTDGILGGQAEVTGVSGTWLDLTNNVNGMANSLTTQVRNIADVTTAVANGDLSQKITIDAKGEILELKGTINKMISVLSNSRKENQNQNWIKDGVTSVNKEVLQEDILAKQAQILISKLARYVNAGMGVLYIYDAKEEILRLEASYAYTKRSNLSNEFRIKEGVVGQVAYEKKPILLTDVAQNAIISTATTENKALNTYTSPIIFKDELIGVVELASYRPFRDLEIEYLESVFTTLSGSLYASLKAGTTKELLVKSQEQSKTLEEASEQLKIQNDILQKQREELDSQTKALEAQTQELEQKNKDLQEAKTEISKAKELELTNRYKSEFLANMSHELRTPLNSMLLLSNSLANKKTLDIATVNKQAEVIYKAGTSLLGLINDVLDLSKVEARLMSINTEEVSFKSLFDELSQLFAPQAEAKKINLKTQIDKNIDKSFITDRTKFTQILKNLIANAIKFTNQNGNIHIKVEPNNEFDKNKRPIKISIKDDGIGIAEEKADIIFEAFQQADAGIDKKYGGTGLGLSISREFTKLLGGNIRVESKLNQGSTFIITFPKQVNEGDVEVEQVKKKGEEKSIEFSNMQKQVRSEAKDLVVESTAHEATDNLKDNDSLIFVVDDDTTFANIIRETAHKLGFKVLVAHDGNSAVSMARDYNPKAILLDLVLPGLNGLDVLKVLKTDKNTSHIPVKVISFNDASSEVKKLGAVDFLRKPISNEDLENAIKNIMSTTKKIPKVTAVKTLDENVSLKNKKVLIVDDDIRNIFALSAILDDEDVDTIAVQSGKEALERLQDEKNSFDVVLMDIMMPDMDGLETIKRIRKMERVKNIPIIALTAKAQKEDKRKCIESGANDYMSKPIDNERLIYLLKLWTKDEKLN